MAATMIGPAWCALWAPTLAGAQPGYQSADAAAPVLDHTRRAADAPRAPAASADGVARQAAPAPPPPVGAPDEGAAAALAALKKGAFERAIDQLELLADRGVAHPDVSYNRGVAYVMRAQSPQSQPGDLGRAAAAFSEASLLRPGDRDAGHALEVVRSEIARRRAREGAEPVAARPSLARAVVGLLSEGVWSAGAVVGSMLLCFGLALRLFARQATTRLAGGIAAPIGGGLLLLCGGLAAAASHYRLSSEPAVVVAPEARLLEQSGTPLRQVDGVPEHVAIPEGASVYVLERRGTVSRVEWGTTRAWVASSQLRVLRSR